MSQPPPDVQNPPRALPLKHYSANYKPISNLGLGSFGLVVLARKTAHYRYLPEKINTLMNPIAGYTDFNLQLVAVKTMNKRLPRLKDYTKIKEVRFILAIPSHVNLVFVHEMFIDDVSFKLHIVMETMDQNLYQFMKLRRGQLFSENSVKSILAQILAGVRHIHRHGYFHRDLKPENVLVSYNGLKQTGNTRLSQYSVKLADYGLARSVENKKPYTAYVSTRWYRLPEILLRQKQYSRPVDIWAFGTVAAEIASFRPLFPGTNELDMTYRILEVLGLPYAVHGMTNYGGTWDEAPYLARNLGITLPFLTGAKLSQVVPRSDLAALRDVVQACLTWDPAQRIDVERLCKMPFFCGTVVNPYEETRAERSPRSERSPRRAGSVLLKKLANQLSPYDKERLHPEVAHKTSQSTFPGSHGLGDLVMLRRVRMEYCSSIELEIDDGKKENWFF